MLLEDPLLKYDGHAFRYASVGGVETDIMTETNSRSIKRTYSDGAKVSALFFSLFPCLSMSVFKIRLKKRHDIKNSGMYYVT